MKDILFIDFETSGTDHDIHVPLELGAVLVNPKTFEVIGTFHEFILPPLNRKYVCTDRAYEINQIDPHNMPEESLSEFDFLNKFFKVLPAGGYTFAAWNVGFDVGFLKKICSFYGNMRYNFDCCDYHYIDVQSICSFLRHKGKIPVDCISFDQVLKFFNMSRNKIHNGFQDANLTHILYKTIYEDFYIDNF